MGAVKTKAVAVGGLLSALTLISLFFATVMPTNKLSLYALSSFSAAVIVIEFGITKGWLFYGTTSLLALIIIPDKISVIPFIAFFGIYGVIKFHIERIKSLVIDYIIKLAYFNACLAAAVLAAKELLLGADSQLDKLPVWIIVIIAEVVFLVYDYVYTLFIQYYNTRLKKMLKI